MHDETVLSICSSKVRFPSKVRHNSGKQLEIYARRGGVVHQCSLHVQGSSPALLIVCFRLFCTKWKRKTAAQPILTILFNKKNIQLGKIEGLIS